MGGTACHQDVHNCVHPRTILSLSLSITLIKSQCLIMQLLLELTLANLVDEFTSLPTVAKFVTKVTYG